MIIAAIDAFQETKDVEDLKDTLMRIARRFNEGKVKLNLFSSWTMFSNLALFCVVTSNVSRFDIMNEIYSTAVTW